MNIRILVLVSVILLAQPLARAKSASNPPLLMVQPVDSVKLSSSFVEAQNLAHSEPGQSYLPRCIPIMKTVLTNASNEYHIDEHRRGHFVNEFLIKLVFVLTADGHIQRMLYNQEQGKLERVTYLQEQGYIQYLQTKLPSTQFPPPPHAGWMLPVIFRFQKRHHL